METFAEVNALKKRFDYHVVISFLKILMNYLHNNSLPVMLFGLNLPPVFVSDDLDTFRGFDFLLLSSACTCLAYIYM